MALLAMAFLGGCSRPRVASESENQACANLAKSVANQESSFLTRVQAIRNQHILLQDYDRQMIAAIDERRAALESTSLTDVSSDEDVLGCSGKQLDDLRLQAREEMANLLRYLETFKRAAREDPAGVYIDSP
jgi:hypothetical protein